MPPLEGVIGNIGPSRNATPIMANIIRQNPWWCIKYRWLPSAYATFFSCRQKPHNINIELNSTNVAILLRWEQFFLLCSTHSSYLLKIDHDHDQVTCMLTAHWDLLSPESNIILAQEMKTKCIKLHLYRQPIAICCHHRTMSRAKYFSDFSILQRDQMLCVPKTFNCPIKILESCVCPKPFSPHYPLQKMG